MCNLKFKSWTGSITLGSQSEEVDIEKLTCKWEKPLWTSNLNWAKGKIGPNPLLITLLSILIITWEQSHSNISKLPLRTYSFHTCSYSGCRVSHLKSLNFQTKPGLALGRVNSQRGLDFLHAIYKNINGSEPEWTKIMDSQVCSVYRT